MQPWKIDLLLLHNFIDSMIYFVAHVQYKIGSSYMVLKRSSHYEYRVKMVL